MGHKDLALSDDEASRASATNVFPGARVEVGRAQVARGAIEVPERGIGVRAALLRQELVEPRSLPAAGVALLVSARPAYASLVPGALLLRAEGAEVLDSPDEGVRGQVNDPDRGQEGRAAEIGRRWDWGGDRPG